MTDLSKMMCVHCLGDLKVRVDLNNQNFLWYDTCNASSIESEAIQKFKDHMREQ